MQPNPQEAADWVTFTEEILNGKLRFFVQWFSILIYLYYLQLWQKLFNRIENI